MNLNHKIYGQGDPIIILHGLFGTLDNWQTVAKELAKDRMVILIDQRDHGRSPHTDDFTYKLLAEDLKGFMDDNWIYDADIIGHSMGGKTAMQFAMMYPDMVNQLIVVDMGPQAYKPGHDDIFNALLAVPVDEIEERKEAQEIISKTINDKGVVLFLMKNLGRKKEGGYEWKMNLALLHEKYGNILEALNSNHDVEVETMFIYGTKSGYITENDIPDIKKIFTNATFTAVDAGHWIHAEKPKEIVQLIQDFL